jgi:DNA-binding response OmpR family regulator
MMSGHPNGMDGVQNNSRPYLMKPFGLKTLSATVCSALERDHSDQHLNKGAARYSALSPHFSRWGSKGGRGKGGSVGDVV